MEYGVVIGKFQTPMLTDGHRCLLATAAATSDHLLIFLFENEIPFSSSNPLPYEARESMVMNFVVNQLKIHATFFKLSDQKYASVLQVAIDETLKHFKVGTENTATLYGGPSNFANIYTGLAKVEKVPLLKSSKTSSYLRDLAFGYQNGTLMFHNGMIKALNWRQPVCHNFIVPLVVSNDSRGPVILLEESKMMKKLTLPTFPVISRFSGLKEQSKAEIQDLFKDLHLYDGSQMESIKVSDWRFRDSDDFCYYHLIYHRAAFSSAPEGYKWLGNPIGTYLFEEEYHPLLPFVNRIL